MAARAKKTQAPARPDEEGSIAGDAVYKLGTDPATGLDILAAGLGPDSATADYEKAVNAVQRLAPSYEFALVDVPAVGTNPEARYLVRDAELAVFIVRRDHDRRDAVRDAVAQVRAHGVSVVGATLTQGTFERGVLSWAARRLGLKQ